MLEDVSKIDITTTVLGMQMRTPIMIDPAGDHARAHFLAESATAKAAAAEGLLMFVSSAARLTLEQIAEAASGPKVFQQYSYASVAVSGLLLSLISYNH
jgi:isopentenyl diphosphate isomerase/L-lactate dehydrogenase-like FMN-dependent dehydrogenase